MKTLDHVIEKGHGRTAIRLRLLTMGRDLMLMLGGGEDHVGALAVAVPGEGGPDLTLLEIGSHREGPLAEECAELICRRSKRTVSVVAGIHYDDATKAEIEEIMENARQAFREMAELPGL
jgi:gallate decarboxylase subunit D